MAYFPTDLLKCVAFIGYKDQNAEFHFASSAFWVSRAGPDDIKDEYRPAYLVTASHVVEKVRTDSRDNRVWIRVNTKDGTQAEVETPLEGWRTHSDQNVDIALLKIGNGDYDHEAWPLESLVIGDKLDTVESGDRTLELGDEVCVAGLFYLHAGKRRNLPIVRVGTVAALRHEPVLSQDGRPMDVYLVESRSIGGLSGSPAFIDLRTAKTARPPTFGWMAGAYSPSSPARFKLLGLISGHFGDDMVADDGRQKVHVNMGITMVVPAEKILEVVSGYATEEELEANDFRERRKAKVIRVTDASPRPNLTIGKIVSLGPEFPNDD